MQYCSHIPSGPAMVSVAAAMLRDRGAAEDVLHDVFVSFAERVPELELTTSLRGYLMAALVNSVRNWLRRTKNLSGCGWR